MNANKIPFDDTEVLCEECGQVYELLVLKNTSEGEMGKANIPQRLINGELDYLC